VSTRALNEADRPRAGGFAGHDGESVFRVWAPTPRLVEVAVEGRSPERMTRDDDGYWYGVVEGVGVGARYRYLLDGTPRPDPSSRAQPDGVHGPSAVVCAAFPWTDHDFVARPLHDLVLYELHVGTLTRAGTFDAVIGELDGLVALGIDAIELMPVAEFPGTRNWGYDGVLPSAAHHAYGGLDGLRRLVDAAHARGVAVLLDVVYNHVGPEGNVLADFGPYFTDRYSTPWGAALNFDGPDSDHVREFFIDSACSWITLVHIDGLRLDAVHSIVDSTAYPFVEQLTDAVHDVARNLGRNVVVIAESADDNPRLTAPKHEGGTAVDAQWSDDFHHALHVAVTGERRGHYVDFGPADLGAAFVDGFVHAGGYSTFRRRHHGRRRPEVALDRLVVFAQNHDQVGNRAMGERLIEIAGFEVAKLALASTLLAPSIPLLFMGEERAARNRFPYFVSHTDPALVEEVRLGRAAEFPDTGDPPDPFAESTFRSAVLAPRGEEPNADEARATETLCRDLIALRRSSDALATAWSRRPTAVWADGVLVVERAGDSGDRSMLLICVSSDPRTWTPPSGFELVCDTASAAYAGPLDDIEEAAPLAPWSARVLLARAAG
jgi:maltooligosyltrehalose trehalohydrolase